MGRALCRADSRSCGIELIFTPTPLEGAFVVELELLEDDRGFFARSFCEKEFEAQSLAPRFVQCNVSFNRSKGTLRGLHYQAEPFAEEKLVRCTGGAIMDVMVDLRPASATFGRWHGVQLDDENRRALYIPKGFAHGFQTLTDAAEVLYLMSAFYRPGAARGIRWDDPTIGVEWPLPDPIVSERDQGLPMLRS